MSPLEGSRKWGGRVQVGVRSELGLRGAFATRLSPATALSVWEGTGRGQGGRLFPQEKPHSLRLRPEGCCGAWPTSAPPRGRISPAARASLRLGWGSCLLGFSWGSSGAAHPGRDREARGGPAAKGPAEAELRSLGPGGRTSRPTSPRLSFTNWRANCGGATVHREGARVGHPECWPPLGCPGWQDGPGSTLGVRDTAGSQHPPPHSPPPSLCGPPHPCSGWQAVGAREALFQAGGGDAGCLKVTGTSGREEWRGAMCAQALARVLTWTGGGGPQARGRPEL